MSNSKTAQKGQCLCGAVTLEAQLASDHIGACHCNTCRTWGGGPFMTVESAAEVTISGSDSVTVYDSSEWAERGFCKHCGSHLFYRLKGPQIYHLAAGLFPDNASFNFDHQVFIDHKPGFYDFGNNTKNLTGAEVFAQFGAEP